MIAPPVSVLWAEHLRKHGPTADPDVLAVLLALAPHADARGNTAYVDEDGELVRVRPVPCRTCGLGLDA